MSIEMRPRDRRALVGLGIALAGYLAIDLVALPTWNSLQQAGEVASAKEDELRRYRRAIERQGRDTAYESELQAGLTQVESLLIQADNPALASAELQSMVEGAAQRTGIGLIERSVMGPRERDEFVTEVGISISFLSTVNQLVSLLAEFRSMGKPLAVPSLVVTPIERYETQAEVPTDLDWTKQLQVTLTVTAPAANAAPVVNP